MKCDQFREALRALHAWDRPDDELPAALRQHASGCVGCGDEWDRVRRLDGALSALARESFPGAPPALEGRLLETFRTHHGHVVSASPQRTWAWLPLAAGIALAVGAGWWFVTRPVPPPDTQAHDASQPAQPVLGTAMASAPKPVAASVRTSSPNRPRAIDAQQMAHVTKSVPAAHAPGASSPGTLDRDPDTVMADFVTLPYGAMPTEDDVHIVEIDVPRDSLYDFGSAAQSGAPVSDMVTADVLIGDDGAPRAFRIVEPTATAVALDRQQSPFGARSPRP